MTSRLKIPALLVISENPSIHFWVKSHLDEGFFILNAFKGAEALETARHSTLDFIILDADFEDSLTLSRDLRHLLRQWPTQILLITGRLKKSYREKALAAGVTDFLDKQLDGEELKKKIEMGKKTAATREKTSDLSLAIPVPKSEALHSSLKNKFVIDDKVLRFLAAAKIEKIPVALLVIQIDQMKEATKAILAEFTELLQSQLRDVDLLSASYEGRFIALLTNTPMKEAHFVAEKLRKEIQRNRFDTEYGPLYFTVSIAVSPLNPNENAFSQMLHSATKSLTQSTKNLIISLDPEAL